MSSSPSSDLLPASHANPALFFSVSSFPASRTSRAVSPSTLPPTFLLSAASSTMLSLRRLSRVRSPARATLRPPTREVATVTPALLAERMAAVTTLTAPSLPSASTICSSARPFSPVWPSCGKNLSEGRWVGIWRQSVLPAVFCFLFSQHLVVLSTSPTPWLSTYV